MRLTKFIREEICRTLVERKFGKLGAKLKKERLNLGMSIYRARWTASERKLMASLPEGWLATTAVMRASVDGASGVSEFHLGESVRIPHSASSWNQVQALVDDPRLIERWYALMKDEEELGRERRGAEREVQSILQSLTTTAKLKEHWPEVSDVVDSLVTDSAQAPRALMRRTEHANELLGLLPEGIPVGVVDDE